MTASSNLTWNRNLEKMVGKNLSVKSPTKSSAREERRIRGKNWKRIYPPATEQLKGIAGQEGEFRGASNEVIRTYL